MQKKNQKKTRHFSRVSTIFFKKWWQYDGWWITDKDKIDIFYVKVKNQLTRSVRYIEHLRTQEQIREQRKNKEDYRTKIKNSAIKGS